MSRLDRAVDRAIARENLDPRGLPADILAGMEADILANPEKYPLLHAAMTEPRERPATITTKTEWPR